MQPVFTIIVLQTSVVGGNTYMIGQAQLRQQRTTQSECVREVPYMLSSCHGDSIASESGIFDSVAREAGTVARMRGVSYTHGSHGSVVFGRHGVYDSSGYILSLNNSRFVRCCLEKFSI